MHLLVIVFMMVFIFVLLLRRPPHHPPRSKLSNEIERLESLKLRGSLSESEFMESKKKLLSPADHNSSSPAS